MNLRNSAAYFLFWTTWTQTRLSHAGMESSKSTSINIRHTSSKPGHTALHVFSAFASVKTLLTQLYNFLLSRLNTSDIFHCCAYNGSDIDRVA